MRITLDTKDSEEDIRKAISMLQRLLNERQSRPLETLKADPPETPKIEIVSEIPKKENTSHNKVISEMLDKKEIERKKDEAFDVGELIPY